ncbi:uncharacterized protein EI97DRAFT_372201 [Westerdykella ornata]|uniref:Uncharacterized protein n=1 Tax=Westerdykella ornata TaxID=318751 RepID=A0A6A6JR90_WESOR|nr:uncharacterized protein EI97DRAFT_372201 [Westerdykella ornata]KAF2278623.1 hypothetical protein EI97DRAFT_372201 [Westerdykella ornata]
MPFELANRYAGKHLIPQPSDLKLNPPESYLYIQDALIIACGVLYALCYMFYMTRTYRDRYIAGSVLYLAGTMAYEIYYAITTTSTTLERICFFVWFLMDCSFAAVAIFSAYAPNERGALCKKLIAGVLAGLLFFHLVCRMWPDEREQVTAYWTGILLQLPIGWGHLYLLLKNGSTKGQSLEMWITRYLGCYTAYGVFFWRYWNVPQNWEYVGSTLSVAIIIVTLVPETVYPFVYVWAHNREREGEKKKIQ